MENSNGKFQAVNQLDTHFNNYVSNAKVKKIHDSFIALRISFDALVYDEFKYVNILVGGISGIY